LLRRPTFARSDGSEAFITLAPLVVVGRPPDVPAGRKGVVDGVPDFFGHAHAVDGAGFGNGMRAVGAPRHKRAQQAGWAPVSLVGGALVRGGRQEVEQAEIGSQLDGLPLE